MTNDHDPAYFTRRAAKERAMEESAIDPAVKRIHRELAEQYEQKAKALLKLTQ
ncbi:hypothetical protein [Sphingomonas sp. 3P27F8]|uniref:hypothetical protein n=1 Tax=Sphingomonas sp. 3P27F8 TaxID=2502213 RepID=UPI0014850C87|nr:hypothetical protein [Sphingomonas sp. 3P27F8]